MRYKGFKRMIALLLTACLCLSVLPVSVLAEDAEEIAVTTVPAENTIEDALVQLGEKTEPAETAAPTDAPAEPAEAAEPAETPETPTETPTEAPTEPAPEPTPAPAATPLRDGAPVQHTDPDGRADAADQTLTVGSNTYILLGSRQQLEALDFYPTAIVGNQTGSTVTENKRYDVTGPIWRVGNGEQTLVYPGDANLVGDFAEYQLYGKEGKIVGPSNRLGNGYSLGDYEGAYHYVCGSLTAPNSNTSYNYGKYSPLNNYVVFRDIDLDNEPWTPLMFYGLMYGVKGSALSGGTTLAAAVSQIAGGSYTGLQQPTIFNVLINTPSGEMDPEKYMSVGFFATLTSSRPSVGSNLQHIQTEVRNLRLEDVRVTNNYNSIHIDQTVVNLLTGTLGTILGGVLDGLLFAITGKHNNNGGFMDSLKDLLNARAKDPSLLATGGFAGRILGKVVVEKCSVEDVQVNGAGSYIGGFVGCSEGVEEYDDLSGTLQEVLALLRFVLNIIPGLGLGDLITVVEHALPLGKLIPVDYHNPAIQECEVVNLQGSIGPSTLSWTFVDSSLGATLGTKTLDAEYNGGFIGRKIATVMIGCGVRDSDYTVYAQNYGGGFAGLARDAVIQELLTDLGVNLGVMRTLLENLMESGMNLQSMQVRCYLNDSNVSVQGGNYLGGFNGAMCNAYSINNEMDAPGKTLTVNGSGDCVGGYTGVATLGWGMSLGQGDQGQGTTSLLSTLKNVLGSLLSSYGTELLSLLGVGQSEILGLQFNYSQADEDEDGTWTGGEASVYGHTNVGGLVGKSDAVIMTGTTGVSLSKISFVEHGDLSIWDIFPDMPHDKSYTVTLRELDGSASSQTVSAAQNYSYTLPDRTTISDTDANGLTTTYEFVGWTMTPCDHSETAPYDILYAGDVVILTGNMTLNALYSRQDYGYRVITAAPTNWEGAYDDYIITWGKDENMVVLTGLADGQNYQSSGSGGANTLTQIRTSGGDQTLFTMKNGALTRVPNKYLFVPDRYLTYQLYYWQNRATSTYLRRDYIIVAFGTNHYDLIADSTAGAGTRWGPTISANGTVVFYNEYESGGNNYLYYDNATDNHYFRMGTETEANACDLYIWGKVALPLVYTTVEEGEDLPVQDNDEIPDDTVIGKYARIRAKGLALVQGGKFVGGLVGLTGTANVAGLLNDTIGVGDFKQFEIHDIEAVGGTAYASDDTGSDGLRVIGVTSYSADDGEGYYVGGGVGMAIGGDLRRISISRMNQVEGKNDVGGFAGCVGPGELLGTGGLNLQLLGLSLLKANNLLAVGQGIGTSLQSVTVTGVPAGYTVKATGKNGAGENRVFAAGGFFGRSNSTGAVDCHAVKVQYVEADYDDANANAGGFIGLSQVGGLASMDDAEGTQIKGIIDAGGQNGLLNAVGYLIPTYSNVDVRFVDTGYVKAACAGGFAADFQSGTVDNLSKDPLDANQNPEDKVDPDWYAVYNVDHVTGKYYAGGFGGKLYSGALADAGGGISVLGALDVGSIDLQHLLGLVNAYVPTIRYAGVRSDRSTKYDSSNTTDGFLVTVTSLIENEKTSGAAGGFVGYGSGVQISWSDVKQLRHTEVTPPQDEDGNTVLESADGNSYYDPESSAYAVTGTRYAGGYAGFLDIGSSASLGGGLSVLNALSLDNALSALNCVISTVEHSDVYGGPGGFAVLSSAAVGAQSGSGSEQSPSGETRNGSGTRDGGENLVTIYVVDQTGTTTNDFRAYVFHKGDGTEADPDYHDGTAWPGHSFSSDANEAYRYLDQDREGHPVYTFTVDASQYNRVIFSSNGGGGYQTTNDTCLKLEDNQTVRTVYNSSVYGTNNWEVTDGSDIWLASSGVNFPNGCRGAFIRYTGVRGTMLDDEINPDTTLSHNFIYVHTTNSNTHTAICVDCGYREGQNCSFNSEDVCTKCGAHKLCTGEHTYVWTHVAGTDEHRQICSVCQAEGLTEACSFTCTHVAGTETHDMRCSVCNYEKETEPCSFSYVHLDGTETHKRVCADCGYETAAEACAFVAIPNEGENTHHHVCEHCGYDKADTEACTFPAGSYYCEVCGRRDVNAPDNIAEAPGLVGRAGGFVGWMRGAHIQDSNSWNFSYIIGQIAAGGYAGEIEPGSVADAVGDTSVLGGLASVSGGLLSVANDFVPTIRNSVTTCIPCGGAVRANAPSTSDVQRGMAGGYVGHNCGGQIWGNNNDPWKDENIAGAGGDAIYDGPYSECAAIRILSVYGAEYAGGFTGLMEAGSQAGSGNVSLLFDLVKLSNPLDALSIAYPTEENTAVYGPLAQLDAETWNKWIKVVGFYGGYGLGMEEAADQEELDAILDNYRYGYHVTAGRSVYDGVNAKAFSAGCAGGYVGAMRSGTVTNGQAYDCKQVRAMRNAGGFAGELRAGSVADLGSADVAGLNLNLGQLVQSAVSVFVPVIKTSSVHGYQNGMTVVAFGEAANSCGNAGGFAGTALGAQIWGEPTAVTGENNEVTQTVGDDGCNVLNLKKVQGARYVGGYFGCLGSGSTAEAGTEISDGPLQKLLDLVASSTNPGPLLSVLNATVSTVRYAKITVADPDWGYTVGGVDVSVTENGETTVTHVLPRSAGGFVGTMEGAIIGNNNKTVSITQGQEGQSDTYDLNGTDLTSTNIQVENLRGVEAQYYAGGFAGMANVGGAASVSENGTNVLSLINLGQISALDIFRPYIYNASVTGVEEGFNVRISGEEKSGTMCSTRYSGCAGGFAGAVLDGHVQNATVENLSGVRGLNYVGGFVGHCGKSGLADVDNADVLSTSNLLNATAGVGDVMGTRIVSSTVTGIDKGYTVEAREGSEPIAGGFVGFADIAKIGFIPNALSDDTVLPCAASKLKLVVSDQIAGGFVGKTEKGYLIELQASSVLLEGLLQIVNWLLELLYVPELQSGAGLQINLLGEALSLSLIHDGELLGVDLLGIPIRVGLAKAEDTGADTDVAQIRIGDSYIELPCKQPEEGSNYIDPEHSNLTIRLLPMPWFVTKIKNCTVTGVTDGYDVFAGGATQEADGTNWKGFAGGFAGYNHLGEITSCSMTNCDVVRGTPAKMSETATVSQQKVGPFTGYYYNDSNWENSTQANKETADTFNGTTHSQQMPPAAPFETDAKVKLMADAVQLRNPDTLLPETPDMQNPCLGTVDLTLSKVWDDLDGAIGTRGSVSFQIQRAVLGSNGTPGDWTDYGDPVTLTAADANPFTVNVWTRKVETLPATNHNTDATIAYDSEDFERYVYRVVEAVSGDYISGTSYADYDESHKLSYSTSNAYGYAAKIINQALLNQTVVLDYGLPVTVDLVDYLLEALQKPDEDHPLKSEFLLTNLEIVKVLSLSEKSKASRYSVEGLNNTVTVTKRNNALTADETQPATAFGTFTIPAAASGSRAEDLKYSPASMIFDEPVYAIAALSSAQGDYYYTKLTVIPATNLYYEAQEGFMDFTDAVAHSWTKAAAAAAQQSVIRPGENLDDAEQDFIYGRDSAYAADTGASLDDSSVIHLDSTDLVVSNGTVQWPTVTFTFTGTGFDVLGQTNNESGYMKVLVYQGTEAVAAKRVASWAVDTYYGMQRSAEKSWYRLRFIKDGEGNWHISRTPCEDMTTPPTGTEAGTGLPILAELPEKLANYTTYTSFVYYENVYDWTQSTSDTVTAALYQVPIISSLDRQIKLPNTTEPVDMPYGTYTVVLQPMYSSFFDHTQPNGTANGYDIHIDGVRIYQPAQGLDEEYYEKDHEALPQYLELRDLLLDQNAYGETGAEGVSYGVFFDSISNPEPADFQQYGPNNEIYLEKNQAIAFRLTKSGDAVIDRIHISAKQVFEPAEGETAALTVSTVVETEPETYAPAVCSVGSTAECYFDVTAAVLWNENQTGYIRILNSGDALISLRDLKVTYQLPEDTSEDPENPEDPGNSAGMVTALPMSAMEIRQLAELLQGGAVLPVVPDDNASFLGAGISLESDFSIHFYVPETLLEGASDVRVVFSKPTEDGARSLSCCDSRAVTVDGKACRDFVFEHISAAELGVPVTATLFYEKNGATYSGESLSYSVRQYAMNMLGKTDSAALRTLLVDLLNYGAEAQRYFGVNADDPVNAALTPAQAAWGTAAQPALSSDKGLDFNPNATVAFEGCSLSLEKQVAVNYYLDLGGCSPEGLELALRWTLPDGTEETAALDGACFEARQLNGRAVYVATLDRLNAAQMRTVLSAVVRNENGDAVSDVMRYSIQTYAWSKTRGTDEALNAVLLAMMRFGDAAEAYFNHAEGEE